MTLGEFLGRLCDAHAAEPFAVRPPVGLVRDGRGRCPLVAVAEAGGLLARGKRDPRHGLGAGRLLGLSEEDAERVEMAADNYAGLRGTAGVPLADVSAVRRVMLRVLGLTEQEVRPCRSGL